MRHNTFFSNIYSHDQTLLEVLSMNETVKIATHEKSMKKQHKIYKE